MVLVNSAHKILPITGKRIWKRADVEQNREWVTTVSDEVRRELRAAANDACRQDGGGVSYDRYELPAVRALAIEIRRALYDGLGFQLLKGLPIDGLTLQQMKFMLMVFGNHVGLVTPQTGDTPEIGEVMDTGGGNKLFYYNRGGAIPMHMDPVDVVGLLCVRKAKHGGESGLSSSMTVHNEILKTRPDLLDILYRGYRHHKRHAKGVAEKNLLTDYCPVYYKLDNETICSIVPHVIEGAVEQGLLEFTPLEAEALEYFKQTAARLDFRIHMDLEPGDLQLLNNRCTLHNRLDYEDYAEADRRRLMLRLWLTMPEWQKLPPTIPHKDAELGTSPA